MVEDSDQEKKRIQLSVESSRLHQRFHDAECKLTAVRDERDLLGATFGTASSQWKDALVQLEQKYLELESTMEDLQELNEQLTQSNAMLLDLKYQADQAESKALACDYEKTKFLARMSHEIRSPLSVILGYTDQILEDELDPEESVQIASQIRGTSEFILELVNEVLDLSSIEAGAFILAAVDTQFVQLLHEVSDLFTQAAVKRGIAFHLNMSFPLPEYIMIDGHRLKQVLVNLCSNAIKFTDQGAVELRATYVDSKVMIEVQDSGIGMTPDQLERIFKPFTQAEDTISARFGGTGLGLYIAHEIVEHMGGKLTATSKVNSGSCFHFELPVEAAQLKFIHQDQDIESTPVAPVKTQMLSGRVLVAEDTPDLQIITGAVLRKAGLEVVMVNNGQQAVDVFKEGNIDLVLLDVEMPVLDGVSALKAMKLWEAQQHGQQAIPILALTAHAFKDDVFRLKDAGFDCIVTKPFKRQELLNLLAGWLDPQPDIK